MQTEQSIFIRIPHGFSEGGQTMSGIDIHSLSIRELTAFVNSTPLGTIVSPNIIDKFRIEAGFRVVSNSDDRRVSFFKFTAFLFDKLHDPDRVIRRSRTYEERKDISRKRNAEQALLGRDIGELPPVQNPERKAACENNFKLFCESYFKDTFTLAWSDDHLKMINKIEKSILQGGLFALAMSRGSGKTTLAECACLWAMLYGHREFIVLVGQTEDAACQMLDTLKTELDVNDVLLEDFPAATYPIQCLDGIANRCAGQLYNGERTRITWTSNEIVLPTIKDSPSSGIIVRCAGILGRIRGMKYMRSDKQKVRPSLVIVDDPQTSESAGSLEQTRKRVRVLSCDILGLAGPGQKISGIMPCTVIRPGDMADQILDRELHPDWNGERTKMVYSFPVNTALWEKYAEIRADSLRETGTISAATAFYAAHREEMDEGARVSWEARFNHDELSALQHAMNLKLQDEAAFLAEYQNSPMTEEMDSDTLMTADEIANKLSGVPQETVPIECEKLTMFIDVQKPLLFYVVCAWTSNFSGTLIDYGTFPKQKRNYFALNDADPTIRSTYPKMGFEGGLFASLKALTEELLGKVYPREDGASLHIERAMIDANWGQSTECVYQFCRQSKYSNILMPSHGRYVGASSKPMTDYKKHPGETLGYNWMIPNVNGKRAIRHVIFDSNFWKTFIHDRLATAHGDKGCLTLYGSKPYFHELISEHFTAEYRVKTAGRGRVVDEWKIKPEHKDNHWLDCAVGCAVAASMCGCSLVEMADAGIPRPQKISLTQLKNKNAHVPEEKESDTVSANFVPNAPISLKELQKSRKKV